MIFQRYQSSKSNKKLTVFLFSFLLLFNSCKNEVDPIEDVDDFDRQAMLVNWADNLIIPAYKSYATQLALLKNESQAFATAPNLEQLEKLRIAWLNANISWQAVSIFEIGKAEEIQLRNFSNIFPTSIEKIEINISSGSYNLALPSKRDQQGFPALDYLINGLDENDNGIILKYSDENYQKYLLDLVDRLNEMTSQVVSDWENGYRDTFVNNNGSSASSSVDKLINDYLFYYEKFLRAGKIGIPAGVFSGSTLALASEGIFHQNASKKLFMAAINACQGFFEGTHFSSGTNGSSLRHYLDYLEAKKDNQNLSDLINTGFIESGKVAQNLGEDFATQVEEDNNLMLATYDELQKNVILLKVDMLQALNVQVDFVDADGD